MGADASEAPSETHPDKTFFGGDLCGPIASTMNESMFQLVILKWRDAFEGLKETHDYKFLSASASLMKIMVIVPFHQPDLFILNDVFLLDLQPRTWFFFI